MPRGIAGLVLSLFLALFPSGAWAGECEGRYSCVCFHEPVATVLETTVITHTFGDLVEVRIDAIHGETRGLQVREILTFPGQKDFPLESKALVRYAIQVAPLPLPLNDQSEVECEGTKSVVPAAEAIPMMMAPDCEAELVALGFAANAVTTCPGSKGGCSTAGGSGTNLRGGLAALVLVLLGLPWVRRRPIPDRG